MNIEGQSVPAASVAVPTGMGDGLDEPSIEGRRSRHGLYVCLSLMTRDETRRAVIASDHESLQNTENKETSGLT